MDEPTLKPTLTVTCPCGTDYTVTGDVFLTCVICGRVLIIDHVDDILWLTKVIEDAHQLPP